MSWSVRFPPSATPFQVAIAGVDAARLAALPVPIDVLWNPYLCPVPVLPYLAWALSVDVWDDSWTEERKRKVIAAAPAVHRLKGTRGAVERALAAFDLEATIVEWWEDGARHGTFRVDVIYRDGGPEFHILTQRQALEAVRAAKPKSRVMTARAALRARGTVHAGGFTQTSFCSIAHPFVFSVPALRAEVVAAVTGVLFVSATAHASAEDPAFYLGDDNNAFTIGGDTLIELAD